MALAYKTRRRLSLLVLLVGLPVYVVVAVSVVGWLGRPPIWLEGLVYLMLGFVWIMPMRAVFRGVGRAESEGGDGGGGTEGGDASD